MVLGTPMIGSPISNNCSDDGIQTRAVSAAGRDQDFLLSWHIILDDSQEVMRT
jgi:hypothetical protein